MSRMLWLGLIALATLHCSKPTVDEAATTRPLAVRVEAAKLDVLQTPIIVSGTVTPSPGADWTISAPETGRVLELPKSEGDPVQAGDLLARFEIPALTAELIARQSDVLQATSRLRTARSAATRLTELVARGIAAQRDLDEAIREQTEAEAAMRQAEAGRDAVELMSSRTVIRARFNGVVARRWHQPGDRVDGAPTDPVLRVIDPARIEITGAVPAAQLPLIAPGQAAKIFNPADGSEIAGSVLMRPVAVDGAVTGEVRVALGPAPPSLTVGAAMQVEIMGSSPNPVIAVPSAAVFREGEAIFVVVAGDDGTARRTAVRTGIITRDRTQIVSGLVPGDKVILSGADPVPDGAAISIVR